MRIIRTAQVEMAHHHNLLDEVPQEDFMGDAPTHQDHADGAEAINGDIMAEHHIGHEDHDDAGFGDAIDINPSDGGILDVELDGMPQDDLANHTEPMTESIGDIDTDGMSHDSDTGSSNLVNFGDDFNFDVDPMDHGGIEIELEANPDHDGDDMGEDTNYDHEFSDGGHLMDVGTHDDIDGMEFNPDEGMENTDGLSGDTESQLDDYAESEAEEPFEEVMQHAHQSHGH